MSTQSSTTHRTFPTAWRSGSSLTELIVAAGLLVTSISLLATGIVAGLKLQRLEQHQTIATDELSNQMEQLLALSPEAVTSAIDQLQPSPWLLQALPTANLEGQLIDDGHGSRIVLKLHWQPTELAKPLVAVGWLKTPHSRNPAPTGDADEA